MYCWQYEATSNLADCVLKHNVISHEYDVYSSYTHPRRESSCRSTSHQDVSSRAERRCRRRWYLGVNRRGRVRTIKTARDPPPMKTFFYRSWFYKRTAATQRPPFDARPSIHNHYATAATPRPTTTAGGRRGRKPGRKWSRPAFPLLSFGRRRNSSRPTSLVGGDDTAAGVECGWNLLRSCGRRRNSSEDRPATNGRRRPSVVRRRGGRRRGVLLRSV